MSGGPLPLVSIAAPLDLMIFGHSAAFESNFISSHIPKGEYSGVVADAFASCLPALAADQLPQSVLSCVQRRRKGIPETSTVQPSHVIRRAAVVGISHGELEEGQSLR